MRISSTGAIPTSECRWCHVHEGINKGNPTNTLLNEGILLKVFYYLENKWVAYRFKRKDRTREKNYFKGKWYRPKKGEDEISLAPR